MVSCIYIATTIFYTILINQSIKIFYVPAYAASLGQAYETTTKYTRHTEHIKSISGSELGILLAAWLLATIVIKY